MASKPRKMVLGALILLVGLSVISILAGPAGWLDPMQESMRSIVLHLRLPRVLGALLAGSALALSGALVQTVLHNPLASANIIGVNASVGFFTILGSSLFPLSFSAGTVFGFFGGLACGLLVANLARKRKASRLTILLAGMAISQLFSAGIDLLTVLVPDALSGYASFKIGSLASLSLNKDLYASILILPAIVLVFLFSRELEMFTLGDRQAQALGLNVEKWSVFFLFLCALLACGVVSLCGMLGFVGLIVPAWLSRYRLPFKTFLLLCVLVGALLVCAADLIGRWILLPWELPAGLVLSLAGGPYFLYLLLERRKLDA